MEAMEAIEAIEAMEAIFSKSVYLNKYYMIKIII
jgi:hypothetical protein